MPRTVNAVVIGGGFFGCEIALELRRLGFAHVLLFEREAGLMRRASFVNQARVHNGYHYPRAIHTARRSHRNFQEFCSDFGFAIRRDFRNVYAIARSSRVNPEQFQHFCAAIDIPCRPAPPGIARLFDGDLVAAAFMVDEVTFDARLLAAYEKEQLRAADVEVVVGAEARVEAATADGITFGTRSGLVQAALGVNATYACLDRAGVTLCTGLKRELTEIAIIAPPNELNGLGVTVMDGPYFSTIPFPAMDGYSLTHVRYTPHESWVHPRCSEPRPKFSHFPAMVRDAARYLPCIAKAHWQRSLFDIKTVLTQAEDDDARPILLEVSRQSNRLVSVLGAKIDNVFEIRRALRNWVEQVR